MSAIVDLNVRVNKWKMRLSEVEKEAKQLREKIAFAEEIINEEEAESKTLTIKVPTPDALPVSLSSSIRKLFKSHPDMDIKNENIFQYLKEKGIPFGKPTVYSILSKYVKGGFIEALGKKGKDRTYRLKIKEEKTLQELGQDFSFVIK
jgi:hypothetical protein